MTNSEISRKVWTNPFYFVACGFGAGLLPWMPGTFGTLVAIPLYLLIQYIPWQLYLAILIIGFVVGVWICGIVERGVKIHDYSGVVWDEIVGYLGTMFLAPHGWLWVILGFILFRLFDIWKPWPISWANDHLQGGFGIMIDDVGAAFWAWIVLQIIVWLAKVNIS